MSPYVPAPLSLKAMLGFKFISPPLYIFYISVDQNIKRLGTSSSRGIVYKWTQCGLVIHLGGAEEEE